MIHQGNALTVLRTLPDESVHNRRSVWTIATQPYPEAHFATYPEKLVEPCILAGSRPGDVVLDPFAGSGTTLALATRPRATPSWSVAPLRRCVRVLWAVLPLAVLRRIWCRARGRMR